VVLVHAVGLLAGRALLAGLAGQAVVDDGAGGAVVVLINVEARTTGSALVLRVAVEALRNEVVADFASSGVGEVVFSTLLAVVLIEAVLALGKSRTLHALSAIRIVVVLHALAASIAVLADLAPYNGAGAQSAHPLVEEVVGTITLQTGIFASALRTVLIEGTALLAFGRKRIQVVIGSLAGHTRIGAIAVNAAFDAL
jgi:hypothetical protein